MTETENYWKMSKLLNLMCKLNIEQCANKFARSIARNTHSKSQKEKFCFRTETGSPKLDLKSNFVKSKY